MSENVLEGLLIVFFITNFLTALGWLNAQRLADMYRDKWINGDSVVADECKCGERNCPICYLANQ